MSRSVAANALAIISGLSIGLIASGFTRGESPTSVPSAGAEAAQLSAGQKRSVSLAIGDNSGYVAWARPPQGAIGAEPVADPQVPAVQAEVRTTASAAGRPPSALAANARRGRSEKALRRISPDSARLHHALRAVPNVSSAERGCIVFFWHTIKTGGTTVRTLFQRQAQLGAASFYYVTHLPAPLWYTLTHALLTDVRPRRLLVEVHNPWGLSPAALAQMREVRERYRPLHAVLLVTFVRRPVPLLLSLYNWRVFAFTPLCQWLPPTDVQTRMLSGNAIVRVPPSARLLSPRHFSKADAEAAFSQWDLVGVLERFDESIALLGRLAGLKWLAYAKTNADQSGGDWVSAGKLLVREVEEGMAEGAEAGGALRAERAAASFDNLTQQRLLHPLGGKPTEPANCEWWGCRAQQAEAGGVFRAGMCGEGSAAQVLVIVVVVITVVFGVDRQYYYYY
mmetsp:Transcript_28804/g.70975  ORF Transcript_28804/g.70975 Transcript_28804/m.70975 type:complete len:452 (-) Transcript_28804:40-1395(-)